MGSKTLIPVLDHKEKGLLDPKSNFRQLVELHSEYAYIENMSLALRDSIRPSEIEKDRQYGIKLFSEHFPGDVHIFGECVVCDLPRAEIAIDEVNGLYFAERIRLHPAFHLTEEGETLITEVKTELAKFECVPSAPRPVETDVRIGKFAAPFLEISTRELVAGRESMAFAIKQIHVVLQKQVARIGGEPEW